MEKRGRPRLTDMQILVLVIQELIWEKQLLTGSVRPAVRWKKDRILFHLERKLIQLKRLPAGSKLTGSDQRHFTILLQQAARQTQSRSPLIVIGRGSQKNRLIRLPKVQAAAKMTAARVVYEDDQDILLCVLRQAIKLRSAMTGSKNPAVKWKRDNLLALLEMELIRRNIMKSDQELTEYGKRHFTSLLARLGQTTKARAALVVMSGQKHNRSMRLA